MTILDNDRGYARPVEEVAKAIYEQRNGFGALAWQRRPEAHKQPYRTDASVALTRLRQLGFINDIGLEAIKAEASSNARDLLTAQAQDQGLYDTTGGGE